MSSHVTSRRSGKRSQMLLELFNQLWVNFQEQLKQQAICLTRRMFPRMDLDELLNATYLRIVHKLETPTDNPLDLDGLAGYAHVTMRSELYDLLRNVCLDQKLKKRLREQLGAKLNRLVKSTVQEAQFKSWRRQFRTALEQAWGDAGLTEGDLEILRVWALAGTCRHAALKFLGLCHAAPNAVANHYDQPKFRALKKVRKAFHSIREWITEGDHFQVSEEFANFLKERLAISNCFESQESQDLT